MQAKVERLFIHNGRRILAVSDIHGEYRLFDRLMKQVGFCEADELFICGDMIEKGGDSLGSLRYFMELDRRENVHILMGNCDTLWQDIATDGENASILHYMSYWGVSLISDMCDALALPYNTPEEVLAAKKILRREFSAELLWLASLPQIIDTPELTFVHGGLRDKPMEETSAWEVMKYDSFLEHAPAFDKWVVAGHMPVNNYCREIGCVNPIFDREKKIASIDGGNVIRAAGQLNCMLLPDVCSEAFTFQAADQLETATALRPQEATPDPFYVVWQESKVELLEKGAELSLCRQLSSGRQFWAGNGELFTSRMDGALHCGEGTNYFLPLLPGDRFQIAKEFSDRYYAKKDGMLGWVKKDCCRA